MNHLRATEFKVGLMILVVAGLFGVMSIKVSENVHFLHGSRRVWFLVGNAAGLVKNSAVRMAGIKVGVVENIRLMNGMARIDIQLDSDILLTSSARAEIRSDGILGDKHVEIVNGLDTDSLLADGGQIRSVSDDGSMDSLMSEVSKLVKSFGEVSDKLKTALSSEGDLTHPAGRIVKNIEKLTEDLSTLVGSNKEKMGEIVDQIHSITQSLDMVISDESDEGFKAAWKRVASSLNKIENTMQNVEEISQKINSGEGTLGRLVNDEKTVEELNTVLTNVNEYLDAGSRLETRFDFRAEYLGEQSLMKSYIGIALQPGLDRYYELQIVDDPKGVIEETGTRRTTQIGTPGETTTSESEEKTYFNKVKFTALFAKNFFNWTVKGGLIENTGGFGVDYSLLNRKLKLSLEAFRFGDINLRATVRYQFFKGFYLVGGADDILSSKGEFSSYLGAGLSLTNDDLKLFASKAF